MVVRSLLPLLLSIFKKRLLAKNSCLLMHLESPLVLTSSVRGSGVTVSMGASVSETAGPPRLQHLSVNDPPSPASDVQQYT